MTLHTFNIIKHRGSPTEAETVWGWTAHKYDEFFVENFMVGGHSYTGFIPVLDYGNHFLYEVPDNLETRGCPSFMCTCGSFGVVLGIDAYKEDQSPEGLKFACYFRNGLIDKETGELHGKHADGST